MSGQSNIQQKNVKKQKILLAVAPYWSPLIPLMGIASLKSYLEPHGYRVKTLDLNVEVQFKELYNRYFDLLKKYVHPDKHGNLHNIGHDVMQKHMMAHIHYEDEKEFIELVKQLVYNIFYFDIPDHQVREFNRLFNEFYGRLEKYFIKFLFLTIRTLVLTVPAVGRISVIFVIPAFFWGGVFSRAGAGCGERTATDTGGHCFYGSHAYQFCSFYVPGIRRN